MSFTGGCWFRHAGPFGNPASVRACGLWIGQHLWDWSGIPDWHRQRAISDECAAGALGRVQPRFNDRRVHLFVCSSRIVAAVEVVPGAIDSSDVPAYGCGVSVCGAIPDLCRWNPRQEYNVRSAGLDFQQ